MCSFNIYSAFLVQLECDSRPCAFPNLSQIYEYNEHFSEMKVYVKKHQIRLKLDKTN